MTLSVIRCVCENLSVFSGNRLCTLRGTGHGKVAIGIQSTFCLISGASCWVSHTHTHKKNGKRSSLKVERDGADELMVFLEHLGKTRDCGQQRRRTRSQTLLKFNENSTRYKILSVAVACRPRCGAFFLRCFRSVIPSDVRRHV